MSKWRTFRRLPAEDKRLFLVSVLLLPSFWVGLRTLGMKRLQAVLANKPISKTSCDAESLREAIRVTRMVEAAARILGSTCLVRSLTLAWLLERRGIPSEVRIGARRLEGGFEAHAWVEAAGTVLNDGADVAKRYRAFDRNFSLARVNWR